jgi:hypothetical protein
MHHFTQTHKEPREQSAPEGPGIVITLSAWWYDLVVRWFVMRGKEHQSEKS